MQQSLIWPYVPLAVVLLIAAATLAISHFLLLVRNKSLGSEARLPRQLLLLALTGLAVVVAIIVAPIPESKSNQILGLLGIVLSGVVALSSAPFVTNFMAAVMLRVTKPFTVGDFIRVGELYGKVSERGIFDTEIQTPNRELIAIPNATFIAQPVTVVRNSGVIVSTTVSLGYDLNNAQTEPLMLEAAIKAGLTDPYVHILELRDFSVNYRVAGLLLDVEGALTAHSELNRQLLNTLHRAGIEIVSPTVTRHINQSAEVQILPPELPHTEANAQERVKAEEIVFDKAREIERLQLARAELQQKIDDLSNDKETANGDKKRLKQSLADIELELKEMTDK